MENQPQSSLAGSSSTGHKRIALVTGANQGIGFEIATNDPNIENRTVPEKGAFLILSAQQQGASPLLTCL